MLDVRIAETPEDIEHCRLVRRLVFIDEQGVSEEEEWDGLDAECTHFLAASPSGSPVGTARLYVAPDRQAKAQRVAVLLPHRGQGVGHALMQALEEEAGGRGHREVVLGAQLTALPFYSGRGYEPYGDVFDDAGIPHRMMRKRLAP